MQTATVLHMENRNEKEDRYRESNNDIRIMRTELNKMTSTMGDLVVAIKGDEYGTTTGLAGQVKEFKTRIDSFEDRLDRAEQEAREAKLEAAKKQFYITVMWAVISAAAGVLFSTIMYNYFKK